MAENLPVPDPRPSFEVEGKPRQEQIELCGMKATRRVLDFAEAPRQAAEEVVPPAVDDEFIQEVAHSTHPVLVRVLRGMAKELAAWRAVDE